MHYEALLVENAERDLEALRDCVAETDSPASADRVLDMLLEIVTTPERFPERGSHPRELLTLGHVEYRQIVRKPWRVFCRTSGKRVHVVLIADGLRDMRSLLAQRLLGA